MSTVEVPSINGKEGFSLSNVLPQKSAAYSVIRFMEENYGNHLERFFKGTNNIFDFALNIRKNDNGNGNIKKALNIFKYGVPAAFMIADFSLRVKGYITDKNYRKSTYEKLLEKIRKLIEVEKDEHVNNYRPDIGYELALWSLNRPETNEVKILGYYNLNSGEELKNLKLDGEFEASILIEFENFKVIWDLKIVKSFVGSQYLDKSNIWYNKNIPWELIKKIESALIIDYVRGFDIDANVLIFDYKKITARKRGCVKEQINQIDVKKFTDRLKIILKSKGRRGFAFIGKQGTGKSLIVKKIEELMKGVTILHLTPDRLKPNWIDETFAIIKNLQPIIVIIEDFDSFKFDKKDEKVGMFINLIDTLKSTIFIITINDTSKVHKTIIDRPQRFDEIIEIKPPQNDAEFYTVIKSSFNAFTNSRFKAVPVKNKISKKIFKICNKNEFTQAAVASAMDSTLMILNSNKKYTMVGFNETFYNSLIMLEESKKALARYKFSNKFDEYENEMTEKTNEALAGVPADG